MLEMRAALAMLYARFDVERVGRADRVGERYMFIVEPVSLQVKLRPRERRSDKALMRCLLTDAECRADVSPRAALSPGSLDIAVE